MNTIPQDTIERYKYHCSSCRKQDGECQRCFLGRMCLSNTLTDQRKLNELHYYGFHYFHEWYNSTPNSGKSELKPVLKRIFGELSFNF
jgi:hypothetical protein